MERAIVLCEGKFGTTTGKTASGLVRRSERYRIVGVVDSTKAGMDAGEVLDGVPRGIPIFRDVSEALRHTSPDWLIIGVATVGGMLPQEFRQMVKAALEQGVGVISGLHEFLSEDEEFAALAERTGARILDIRREPPLEQMHSFGDKARHLDALRIPVLGTDSAIGKRTTAVELVHALIAAGVKAVFVATGQTGLLQGARYGVPLDAIQGDYMVGELEHAIAQAYENEQPEVIVVEGQGSISHPAYVCGSRAILSASAPSGVVLQHAPGRTIRNYHPELRLPMPSMETEMRLIEAFSGARVIALTINHEGLSRAEVETIVKEWESKYSMPACDPLWDGCERIVDVLKGMMGGKTKPETNGQHT
ncbi:MAG: DUF1611 domain-containing protein [Candidatus Thermoplasmatota archaeon]